MIYLKGKENIKIKKSWNITKEVLLKMKKLSDQNSITFIVVFFDRAEVIYPELWQEFLEKYPEAKKYQWDKEKPRRILKNFLAENNIPYLDLTEKFINKVNKTGEKTYFPCDGHWNDIGHRWAAEEIYNFLVENGYA